MVLKIPEMTEENPKRGLFAYTFVQETADQKPEFRGKPDDKT